MSIVLSEPSLGRLEIDDGALGYCVESVEVSGPEVRAVVNPRVLADGTFDRTRFVGARTVTITMQVVEGGHDLTSTRMALVDRIAPYLHPGRRVDMFLTLAPRWGAPRLLRVRGSDWSIPWEDAGYLSTQFQWVTYDGPFFYSADERSVTLGFAGLGEGRDYYEVGIDPPTLGGAWGRRYDRTYPYAATTVANVVNHGNVWADWTARIDGPVTGFSLYNLTSGQGIVAPDLDIPAGQFLLINSQDHTLLMDGQPGSSRYSDLDFERTQWWLLAPGTNRISNLSQDFGSQAATTIRWRDAFM